MHPWSSPSSLSVTNVAPGSRSQASSQPGRVKASRSSIAARAMARRRSPRGSRSAGLMEGEGAIAHDAVAVAGGVAGVAQVHLLDREAAAARLEEQPVDRRGAARLLGIERGLHREDRGTGLAVAK